MAESHPLSGPDLSIGVAADSVKEGQPLLLGHAEGEAVMLVRAQGRLFAAAASCTHYGGPLAEGLVVGTRVHCPWHHACFDLETGLPAGPALSPIACFDVINAADLVRVGKRLPPYAAPPAPGPSSVVIVGAGPAGVACADMLRHVGYSAAITLLGDEPPGPVDRPNLSKDYLAGAAEEAWIPLHEPDYYREQRIDLVLGDAAKRIDPVQHRVELTSGRSLDYGALLLATGSAARRLPIPGAELDHVLTLRTLADSRAIIAKATPGARAVIIGSSFIGLDVAASLRAREVAVDLIAMEAIPLTYKPAQLTSTPPETSPCFPMCARANEFGSSTSPWQSDKAKRSRARC